MLARAHLLYGSGCAASTACQMLEEIGMEAFAQRGRRELRAADGTTRKRAVTTTVKLTAQEARVARLAADGLSNPEIGTRLFLSPHRPVPPPQGLHQAGHHLARPAQPRPIQPLRHQLAAEPSAPHRHDGAAVGYRWVWVAHCTDCASR